MAASKGDFGSSQISVLDFGEQSCPPSHSYGPAVRPYYLVHFVESGKGVLFAGGREWPVQAGQGFLIYPGEVTTYRADPAAPWRYAWVSYAGEGAEALTRQTGFSHGQRVLSSPRGEGAWQALSQLREDAATLPLGPLAALGGLYRFLALLSPGPEARSAPEGARHYEKALWFMQGAYTRAVTVQEIADFVGLSRSQLFRVFEQSCGRSPKQALQEMRLEQARLLLRTTALPVEQIALSCGLGSAAQMGAIFRRRQGQSPRAYRRAEEE